MTEMMDLYGIGDHGGGPTRAILDEGFHWADRRRRRSRHAEVRVRHRAALLLDDRKADCARQPGVELPVDRQGLHCAARCARQGLDSDVEERALLRISPRRDDDAGQPQTQHARVGEEEVLNAEKWASLAWLDGDKYPAERTHRGLEEGPVQPVPRPGRGLGHRHHLQGRAEGLRRGALVDERDLRRRRCELWTSASTRPAAGIPVVVYNPLGWERSGEVSPCTCRAAKARSKLHRERRSSRPAPIDEDRRLRCAACTCCTYPRWGTRLCGIGAGDKAAPSQESDRSAQRSPATPSRSRTTTLRVTVDKQSGCITSLFDKKSELRNAGLRRLRQPAAVLQRHAEGLRRVEHRSRHARRCARRPSITPIRLNCLRPPSQAIRVTSPLAEFEIRADLQPARQTATWSTSTTTSTGTKSHILLKAAFPLAATSHLRPTRFPMAPSTGRPRATIAGRRRSLKCRRSAGPISAMASTASASSTSRSIGYDAVGQSAAAHVAALAHVARSRCRPGPSSLPLRALSACRHVERRDDRAPRL